MNYPIEKYRFIETGNKIIAISTYAGKTVRGVAKCDPRDTFDVEKGKEIAAMRCAHKIAQKRMKRANRKYEEAMKAYANALTRMERMKMYATDARNAEFDLAAKLSSF